MGRGLSEEEKRQNRCKNGERAIPAGVRAEKRRNCRGNDHDAGFQHQQEYLDKKPSDVARIEARVLEARTVEAGGCDHNDESDRDQCDQRYSVPPQGFASIDERATGNSRQRRPGLSNI